MAAYDNLDLRRVDTSIHIIFFYFVYQSKSSTILIMHVHCSGGIGCLAGLALVGALFDRVMKINIELLIGTTGPPHFTHHYALLRMHEIHGSDFNGLS